MSSSDLAVSVRGLSKSYVIDHNAVRHTTAAEAIAHSLRKPRIKREAEIFWALQDINFDIARGDVVGIVGRNGAGKSTLLKILSRIVEPTSGQIDLYGKVGSLLEVGTGFHPELTGRENIFLNGAILGMPRREILKQFDAIVEFSDTEKFLDTPVKRFSSGMYVRLAFAVAAHLNPEILIVDEVLAVGDAEFQKKCLGKMKDVASTGRTVLLVSHNMSTVMQLCQRAIYLESGRLRAFDTTAGIIDAYTSTGDQGRAEIVWNMDDAPGDTYASIQAIRILNEDGLVSEDYKLSSQIVLEMEFWCHQDGTRLNPSFHVLDRNGVCLFATWNMHDEYWGARQYRKGVYRAQCVIPPNLLNEGTFHVPAFLVRDLSYHSAHVPTGLSFNVIDDAATRGDFTGQWIGAVRPVLPWTIEPISQDLRDRSVR